MLNIEGFWTGRKMLLIFQLLLIGALIGESIIVLNALHYVHQFESMVNKLDQGERVSFLDIESSFQSKFDPFFYGASSSCSGDNKIFILPLHNENI